MDSDLGHTTAPAQGRSVLFVCTGNTCRSPLAEALCKQMLADRIGCAPEELANRGFVIRSAGVHAYPGDAPSAPAVDVAAEFGADLSNHRSRPVNPELLATATDIFTMTHTHAVVLTMRFPGVGPEPRLLCGPDGDLPDPFGGDVTLYRQCGTIIRERLTPLIDGWVSDSRNP